MAGDLAVFIGQVLRRPHQVVALAPSSQSLAAAMAAVVTPATGRVAELGPGTGRITRALLPAASGPTTSPVRAQPDLLHPAARALSRRDGPQPLCRAGRRAVPAGLGAVISGLPLLSMSEPVQRAIVAGAFAALRPDGVFVQFTYGPRPPIASAVRRALGLGWSRSAWIFDNLPPACVYTFRRQPD